ncbi:hypothetical protein NL676_004810 [Syzygium grande]|nr:hypothetical protein NL676_004810 [Syzygium grande]
MVTVSSSQLKGYLKWVYATVDLYNNPFKRQMEVLCNAIDRASPRDGILRKIFTGLVALIGNSTCYVNPPYQSSSLTDLVGIGRSASNIIFSNALQDPYSSGEYM